MKILKLVALILVLSIVHNSCKQACSDGQSKKLMGDFYKKKLIIPNNWILLNGKYVSDEDLIDPQSPNAKFYVIKYFSVDCDKCIEQLEKNKTFIDHHKKEFPQLKFIFVAYGSTDVFIKEAIEKFKFGHPVYLEKDYLKFFTVNKIPVDNEPLYGTMLVNQSNELLLFGSIYDNAKAKAMFTEIINCK